MKRHPRPSKERVLRVRHTARLCLRRWTSTCSDQVRGVPLLSRLRRQHRLPGSGSAPTGAPVQLPVPPTPTLGADQLQQLMLQMLNNQNTALCRWANSLAGSRWGQTNTAAVLPQTRRRSRLTNLTALPENGGIPLALEFSLLHLPVVDERQGRQILLRSTTKTRRTSRSHNTSRYTRRCHRRPGRRRYSCS